MEKEILALLNPQLAAEMAARYFYEAARMWARSVGYPGLEQWASCYQHYKKHNVKMLLNIFADWEIEPDLPNIESPGSLPNDLPGILQASLDLETNLMNGYNTATHDIFDMDLGVYNDVRKLQKRQVEFYQEMGEYVDKLDLFNLKNRLDIVYYDRKILSWPSRK